MITVIVPSYKHQKFLKQRIDSILAQTYRDFEVIILEDNSGDGSKEILHQYETHEKIKKIIYNEKNSGSVFKQWVKGIELSDGDFIWIAESDDYADPTFLEKMIPVLERDASIALVYCNANIVDENDVAVESFKTYSDIRNYKLKTQQWSKSFIMDGKEFLQKYLSKECWVNNASAVLFNKQHLKALSFDLSEYRFGGDWAVYMNLAMNGKIAYLNEKLSYYREHPHNASKKSTNNNSIDYDVFKIISTYYNHLSSEASKKQYVFDMRASLLAILVKSGNRAEIYKRFEKINSLLLKASLKHLPRVFIEMVGREFSRTNRSLLGK